MNIAQAKCIPIASYLERQGHQPKKTRLSGRELWYQSPIRCDDENPSFKVDTVKNLWFDHGLATGGTIIELVCDMCSCNVRDALQHLDKSGLYSPALARPQTGSPSKTSNPEPTLRAKRGHTYVVENTKPAGEKEKTGALELIKASPLTHPALLQYLTKRKIDHKIACEYVSQIDFKGPQGRGTYFGLGFPSGGGYEVRNALFKGFVGTEKSVSFIDDKNSCKLLVFEGFMDFLSFLTDRGNSNSESAVLVLNSTNLWRYAVPYMEDKRFDEVTLFLDNDTAGDAVTKQFLGLETPAQLQDARSRYAGFDDYNAWLMAKGA